MRDSLHLISIYKMIKKCIMMTRIDIIVYGPIHLGQDDLVVVDHGYDDVLIRFPSTDSTSAMTL